MKLNLGCGKDIKPGWVNIDRKPYPGVDLVLDLARGPLPFQIGSIDAILAHDVLEHLHDWETVVLECARVLRPGGTLEVHVPYRWDLNAYHVRMFDEKSFEAFVAGSTDFDGPNATTLDGVPAFRRVSRTYDRRPFYPFAWHMNRYLGAPVLGRRTGMTEILERLPTNLFFDPLTGIGP